MAEAPVERPQCLRCRHYYITYDVRFPYGCRAMGFKSRRAPQEEILTLTGVPCQTFELRPGSQRKPR